MAGVRTVEIYKGVLPYIVIQFCMILIVIAFPGLVLTYKAGHTTVDPDSVKIEVPSGSSGSSGGMTLPPLGDSPSGMGLPPLNFGGPQGAPGGTPQGGSQPAPTFGLPPLELGGPQATPGGASQTSPQQAPALGLPPLELGGPQGNSTEPQKPAPAAQPDLSQPPKITP